MNEIERVPGLVREIYRVIAELESIFPGRRFTMDGHLVGSIGEVVASSRYDLQLFASSTEGHDAVGPGGRRVQIKATQGGSIGIRSEPEHLLVLKLLSNGDVEEVFNGPGPPAWQAAGRMQKNGQRSISVTRLRKLMSTLGGGARMPERK